jgi:hypothetical protein
MINGPTMFAHPAKFPAAVKARYIGAHQATFGLGLALGPVFGVVAWETLGSGVWLLCGVLGAIAALCALEGMRETAPQVVDHGGNARERAVVADLVMTSSVTSPTSTSEP